MDIYYHISTAWGFIRAGGYSSWDFWQFAPVGRPHIYPPLFHLALAFLMKAGLKPVLLAKVLEAFSPVLFLVTLKYFISQNCGKRLAFFVLMMSVSSSSFYLSLINHIPATLAMIFGILTLGELLKRKFIRAAILLTLVFYTHIGLSWVFFLAVLIYALFDRRNFKYYFAVMFSALVLALPVLARQLSASAFVARIGLDLNETRLLRFKIIEYLFACLGLIVVLRSKKYRIFACLFFASLILLAYPYRFFSAEGYLGIAFLSAVGIDFCYNAATVHNKQPLKYALLATVFIIVVFSPSIVPQDSFLRKDKQIYQLELFDSALPAVALPGLKDDTVVSMWLPGDYLPAAEIIKSNSCEDDVVFSSINIIGVALSAISGRATANGLLPEINPMSKFDPVSASKVIVFAKDDDPQLIGALRDSYNLRKVAESKLFLFYDNPHSSAKAVSRGSRVGFIIAAAAVLALILGLILGKKVFD